MSPSQLSSHPRALPRRREHPKASNKVNTGYWPSLANFGTQPEYAVFESFHSVPSALENGRGAVRPGTPKTSMRRQHDPWIRAMPWPESACGRDSSASVKRLRDRNRTCPDAQRRSPLKVSIGDQARVSVGSRREPCSMPFHVASTGPESRHPLHSRSRGRGRCGLIGA
jgi:hypothetical protein